MIKKLRNQHYAPKWEQEEKKYTAAIFMVEYEGRMFLKTLVL
jgi:hypothetical protein